MNNEEIYHLINLLEIRMTGLLINKAEFRILSDDQKIEALGFDRDLIFKLKDMIKEEENE